MQALAKTLAAQNIEAVAVCFLHAYANPAHERRVGEILRAANPKLFVTLSHEIVREYREYERTSTTALNAFIGPRVQTYLGRLESHLRDEKFAGKLNIMRSNGGVMSVRLAQEQPVSMMESGPVAGIIGAGRLAALMGIERAIGFDMGGTTAKASLITNGIPAIEDGYVIGGEASGQPMQIPVVDIVEIGAGGGSIAWCDPTGGIHVGPKSAGADPGPAAYGKGSTDPVVTDANLVLGRINAERFLNGAMKLDVKASERAIEQKLCGPTRLGVKEAALGIVQIADAAMSLAVRAVSVKKGVDPRETAMIAFGGAGAAARRHRAQPRHRGHLHRRWGGDARRRVLDGRTGDVAVWTSPRLTSGTHTISVRVTGTQRSAATNDWGVVDRFEIANHPTAGTNYRIVNRNSGKPLAVAGGSTADGALVVQKTSGGAWTIGTAPGGAYTLNYIGSGKALDVDGYSSTLGLQLQQWTPTAAPTSSGTCDPPATGTSPSSATTAGWWPTTSSGTPATARLLRKHMIRLAVTRTSSDSWFAVTPPGSSSSVA